MGAEALYDRDEMLEAIGKRTSRRSYLTTPLSAEDVAWLEERIALYNERGHLRMRLVTGDKSAFTGFSPKYGMFSGVRNYIAFVTDGRDAVELEKVGYYGELLVLLATSLGLGTCWVGGSFNRKAVERGLTSGHKVPLVVALGNVEAAPSGKERLIRGQVHRKVKPLAELYTSDGPVPDWFMDGMRAVAQAPSAANRQAVVFDYRDGAVVATVKGSSALTASYDGVDLGIAKAHFEIGADDGTWAFGKEAAFTRS